MGKPSILITQELIVIIFDDIILCGDHNLFTNNYYLLIK